MNKLIALLAMLSMASVAHANILTGPVVNPANGHSYYLLEQDTWTNSEASAQTLGGHLVTINDQAENDWVFNTFAPFAADTEEMQLWIGLTRDDPTDPFEWVNGEPLTYTNWLPTEPTNGSGDLHARMGDFGTTPGSWADVSNAPNQQINGVVEVIPEPASLALLGLGGLTLLCRRGVTRVLIGASAGRYFGNTAASAGNATPPPAVPGRA